VPGQALVPEWAADSWGVRDGDEVVLGERTFRVLVVDVGQPVMLTADDLRAVAPGAAVDELWLRLADGDPDRQVEVVDTITDLVAEADPSAQVTGLVTMRAQIDE